MNKETKSQYVSMIADALTEEYGDTLREYDTDIAMAKAVVERLTPYLYFRQGTRETQREFREWKAQAENR